MAKLLERTWVGAKPFYHIDPESGKRVTVHHGETVKVSPTQAEAYEQFMVEPKVAQAQKAAKQAQEAAKAETKQATKSEAKPSQGEGQG